MIIYDVMKKFYILGTVVALLSDETAYGFQTYAESSDNGFIHYLGDVLPNLETAINVWQDINNRWLSQEEIESILIENAMNSYAV